MRLMERRESYAGVADWPDIGQHAEALETRARFMRAFCVLMIAALASVCWRFRSVLVAVPRQLAVRVHRLVRGHPVRMGAFLRGQGRFCESSRSKTAARVEHQAQGDEYGQEGAHRHNADLSLDELNAER